MANHYTTIEINGGEYNIRFDYICYPAEYGAREHGTGLQLEPDIPAHVDVENVEIEHGQNEWHPIDFPEHVIRDLEKEVKDYL